MKKLRIYLDTSVINFLFADDAPEKRDITRKFFEKQIAKYEAIVSAVVLGEINKTKVSKALLEVWKWKDECYREVAHLSRRKAISALLQNAERVARELNLGLKPATLPRRLVVAETPATYEVAQLRTKSDFSKKIVNKQKRNKK